MKTKSKNVTRGRISRREFVVRATGAAALAGFPAILSQSARAAKPYEGKTIRLLTWSDASGQAAVNHIVNPFMADTGAKVVAELVGATSMMISKVKASASNPQYDLIILSDHGAIELGKAGVLQKADEAKLPNMADVDAQLRWAADGFGIGYYIWTNGLLYNNKVFETAPNSYEAMWSDTRGGKITLMPSESGSAMDFIALTARMAGGDEHNAEPGWKKLAELKKQVLLLSWNPAQISELVRSRSVTLGALYSPSLMPEFVENPQYNGSITLSCKEGFVFDRQYMIIPKGHPGNSDVIHALVNRALDPVAQGRMAEAVNYGPINKKAVLSEKAKKAPFILTADEIMKRGLKLDRAHISAMRPEWSKRYKELFAT